MSKEHKSKLKDPPMPKTGIIWAIKECIIVVIFKNIFIYLFGCTGLSGGTQDLQPLLRHVGSLVVACALLTVCVACEVLFPDQGSNLGTLHWEHGMLVTGPAGKSCSIIMQSIK